MNGLIHIDTLYLIVKYPKLDIFQNWYRHAENINYRQLKEGIVHGDFVVKGGASCYKVSVWQHDARAFFTDQVDEKLGENKGSGIWVQLGPKFLISNDDNLHDAIKDFLISLGVIGDYPIKINRLDLAMDLFGISMKEQDLSLWQQGWVGRSKISSTHFNSRTGELETINIGARTSPVYLRIYDKIAQALKEGDLLYWLDIWKGYDGDVTRVEWEIKPCEGGFQKELQDFGLFSGITMRELLNYLLEWGRLCIPNPSDSNNRRWKESQLWEKVRSLAETWVNVIDWPLSRYGKEFHGITEGYINFVSGAISGAMARFGLDEPSMINMIKGLEKHGHGWENIQKVAERKAAIISRL